MNLAQAAAHCREGKELPSGEVSTLLDRLLDPQAPEEQKEAFLLALKEKGETPAELEAFVRVLREKAVALPFSGEWDGEPLVDCCGTGGGGLNLVNVSTALLFVLPAAGVPVVKHGNRAVTKSSGSADVLEALGVRIDLEPEQVAASLRETGSAFVFAPRYHPVFKGLAPLRKKLAAGGHRTIFNLLGPLLNPARPACQILGVFRKSHLALFASALQRLGCERVAVVHGSDAAGIPIGEASPLGETFLLGRRAGKILERHWPADGPATVENLLVDGPARSAARLTALLEGREEGTLLDLVAWNAGIAFWVQGKSDSAEAGRELAVSVIRSGAARDRLEAARRFARSLN
jgi:anthranilate phosphoribosyltransferase